MLSEADGIPLEKKHDAAVSDPNMSPAGKARGRSLWPWGCRSATAAAFFNALANNIYDEDPFKSFCAFAFASA